MSTTVVKKPKTEAKRYQSANALADAGQQVESCTRAVLDRLDVAIKAADDGARIDEQNAQKFWPKLLRNVTF